MTAMCALDRLRATAGRRRRGHPRRREHVPAPERAAPVLRARRRRVPLGPRREAVRRLPRRVRRDLPRPQPSGGQRAGRPGDRATRCCSASASPRRRSRSRARSSSTCRRPSRSSSATAARRRRTTRSGSRAASPAASGSSSSRAVTTASTTTCCRNVLSTPRARRAAGPAVDGHARRGGRRDARLPLQRPRGRRGDGRANPEAVAAIIVEPIAHNSPGLLPAPGLPRRPQGAVRPRGDRADLRRGHHGLPPRRSAATRRSAASRPT